ncbi:MAG TPA: hypothetical protein VGG27_13490 [Magnetospirillaceae bacterium]|jgi:hypothetical protein
MSPQFLDVPVTSIAESANYVEKDLRHIYPHLKHMLSLPSAFPFPAVHVRLEDGKLVLVSGSLYWKIACELGKDRIRAALELRDADPHALENLPSDVRRIPDEEIRKELAVPVVRGWHVYFFDGPLSEAAREAFRKEICGFFENLETALIPKDTNRVFSCGFSCEFTCAQFEALIPVADKSWFKRYRDISVAFSNHTHRIVSFQGARFTL